jgi:hypothetical protein
MSNLGLWLGFFVGVSATAGAQTTAANLHNRYAQPNREEMQARPGVSVTVQYGLDQQACEIRIHPTTTSLLMKEPEAPMLPEIVSAIIDEIVPQDDRGKPGTKMIEFAGCNVLRIDEYESVTISRSAHECLPLQPERENPAILTFKKPECVEIQKARTQP